MVSFFDKTKNGKVLFKGDGECIYYIPEKYFINGAAEIVGEVVNAIGMFSYAVFDKNGKRILFKPFSCPTTISCKPYKIDKEANFHLEGTREPKPYRLLYFHEGDELLCSVYTPKEFDNIELFVKLFSSGNLPENIPYDEIQNYIIQNAQLNNFNYKVSNQIIGMVISELCRDPKDLTRPFRYTDMSDMTAYKAIRIEDGPKYTSPFTAVTSDNADEAIAAAITTAGTKDSPLEKIMMG